MGRQIIARSVVGRFGSSENLMFHKLKDHVGCAALWSTGRMT